MGIQVAPPSLQSRGLRRWLSPQLDALPAKGREQQLSNRSIVSLADSHTEFFHACEVFLSASSSENEVRPGLGVSWQWGGALQTPPPPRHPLPLVSVGSSLPFSPPSPRR